MISFRLSKPARLLLTVSGPGPGCAFVARGVLAGRSGLNRFLFDGSVSGGKLNRGAYRLELTLRDGTLLAHTFVTIVDPTAPDVRFPRPDCDADSLTLIVPPPFGPVSFLIDSSPGAPRARPAPSAAATAKPARERGKVSDVLGEAVRRGGIGLPIGGARSEGESGNALALALLAIMLAALLALVVGLLRSLRRGRPPA